MASARESDDLILADRLVGYADAIAAVAFLGVSGLGVTIADPDMRCTLALAVVEVAIATFLNGVLFLAIVAALRRAELDLRSGYEIPEKAARYGRMLHLARYAVVGVSFGLSLVLLAVVSDASCDVVIEPEVAAALRSAD
jgi:hypothetical protein